VPSLYFASGLPFAVVNIMASIMYKKLGIPNDQITEWLTVLGFAWVVKPLWSPFLEIIRSKKAVVVTFQTMSGLCLLATAYTLQTPGFFIASIAFLSLVSFASATHDIAADGLFIENLSTQEQRIYSGWLGAFWNGGKLFVQGALVALAGYLEATMSHAEVWTVVTMVPGGILLALAAYHAFTMPPIKKITTQDVSIRFVTSTMVDVLTEFFRKPGIWVAILFIILFRAGEGQVQTIGRLFLIEGRENGGLGLTTTDMGIIYGTFGAIAFICGSIVGGYFAAWQGLRRRTMAIMILAMNVPHLTFWYLSAYLPTDFYVVTVALSFENFGFGFGFVGLTLYMMQVVAPGKYPTAHYALATGIMQLGLLLSTWPSGRIQQLLGYQDFFVWGVLCALPVFIMSLLVSMKVKEKGHPIDFESDDTVSGAPAKADT
jgi:PAT family beta-lactamase induction signal transducer AmpG